MKKIKWLYSIVISTAFLLVVAWTGAFFVSADSVWYHGLFLPDFTPSSAVFSWLTGITYCIFIALISKLFMKNMFLPYLPMVGVIGFLTAIWPALFFGAHSPLWALIDLAIITLLGFILLYKLLSKSFSLGLLFLPALGWYCFLLILNYALIMLN